MAVGISGRPPARAHPDRGGLALEKDGVPAAGTAQELDLIQTPGVIAVSVVEDGGNDRNDVTFVGDGMKMLVEGVLVNARVQANTAIFVVPGGVSLLVEAVILRCIDEVGVTIPASAGVGFNGAADNVYGSQILTGLDAAGLYYLFPQGGTSLIVPAAATLSVGIDVIANGTLQFFAVDLIGRLF